MEPVGTLAAAPEIADGSSCPRPSSHREWYPLAQSYWRPLAGSARAVWSLANRRQPLLPLAESWRLGAGSGSLAATSGCARCSGLVTALCGWQRHPCPSACSRRPAGKGGAEQQALGRSQGGFSTKLHLRAEGCGKPITFLLTAGQRHEQS